MLYQLSYARIAAKRHVRILTKKINSAQGLHIRGLCEIMTLRLF